MEERLKSDLTLAAAKAAYDAYAKQILAHKVVLAHILASVVPEYTGMKPEEVVSLIEGTPKISEVSVLPGETTRQAIHSAEPGNRENSRDDSMARLSGNADLETSPVISGMNTENTVPNEGRIAFDIRFYVWHPDRKRQNKIIVDVEAQKKKPGGYDIVTKGIFYNARQLSAQLDTEFEIPYYNKIKKVYSIWICMNVPEYLENTAVLYEIQPRDLIGTVKKKGRYDLLTVIEVNLGKNLAGEQSSLRLHRLLGTLLSPELRPKEKTEILEQEYGIETTGKLRKGMQLMCNLSEAIEEKGRLEERANTERERSRAEEEKCRAERECRRADAAEAELERLKKELEKIKAANTK